eukprot:CAMPEP_0184670390 /NCGR_PEP_ID=MMETSP0308-20130426/81967_1 /TAXON_ID=38269 /ORGANISM="Gloeochaete witrockiana, Strain SAG 46.84" /LENGTH=92 /DNA_ID=CAMNT_0027117105 /DNA_START=276 /DNA_END=554 /DNA_ORIENTATION=-
MTPDTTPAVHSVSKYASPIESTRTVFRWPQTLNVSAEVRLITCAPETLTKYARNPDNAINEEEGSEKLNMKISRSITGTKTASSSDESGENE